MKIKPLAYYIGIFVFILLIVLFLNYRHQKAQKEERKIQELFLILDNCATKANLEYGDMHVQTCRFLNMGSVCRLDPKREEGLNKIKEVLLEKCINDY